MQCPSCHFRNMPGTPRCVQCHGVLDESLIDLPSLLAIDVRPRRESTWRRRRFAIRRLLYARIGDVIANDAEDYDVSNVWDMGPLAVPGLFQAIRGRWTRAVPYFVGWAGCLAAGLIFLPTARSMVMLGMAISLHASSILDALFRHVHQDSRFWRMLTLIMACFVAYAGIALIAGRFVGVRRLAIDSYLAAAGEVYWHTYDTPQTNDLIWLDRPAEAGGVFGGRQYQTAGLSIGRVVAVGPATIPVNEDGTIQAAGTIAQDDSRLDVNARAIFVRERSMLVEIDAVPIAGLEHAPGNAFVLRQISTDAYAGTIRWRSLPLSSTAWIDDALDDDF